MSVLRNTFTTLRKEYQRVFQREADKHLPEITDTLRNVAIFQVLSRGTLRALADAVYQQAEIHRLRGAHQEAEDAYRRASELGREPQPGLALLRVAQDYMQRLVSDNPALADAVHTRTYKKDEYLYFEQDPGLGLYIVQSGRIRLLIEDEDGSVQLLRQVDAYDLFGYLSIFGDFRRTETAQAVTETRVIGFFRPDLNTLIKRDPKAGAAILGVLANYLATQLVEMDNLLEARDGKLAAGRLLHGAAQRVEGSESGSPLTG